MWSAVFSLHVELLHFMTTYKPWPATTESAVLRRFCTTVEKSDSFWEQVAQSEIEVLPPSAVPSRLSDLMEKTRELFDKAAKGRTSPFVLPVPIMQALEDLFNELFGSYEGLLGDRTNERYVALWGVYVKKATKLLKEDWEKREAEIRNFNEDSEDVIALKNASRKWEFYVFLQNHRLVPMLPVPTASVLRRLECIVESCQWGVYSVSGGDFHFGWRTIG